MDVKVGVNVGVILGLTVGSGIQVHISKSSQPVSNDTIFIPTEGASSNCDGK